MSDRENNLSTSLALYHSRSNLPLSSQYWSLKCKKEERIKQFSDIRSQIEKIRFELSEHNNQGGNASSLATEEHDLSTRKLNSYQAQLRALQKDKVYIPSLPVCFPEVLFFSKCVFLKILVLVLLIAKLLFDRVSTGASSAYITEKERANTDAKECLVIYKLSHFTQKNISSESFWVHFPKSLLYAALIPVCILFV
jgi:hypothetical protein